MVRHQKSVKSRCDENSAQFFRNPQRKLWRPQQETEINKAGKLPDDRTSEISPEIFFKDFPEIKIRA